MDSSWSLLVLAPCSPQDAQATARGPNFQPGQTPPRRPRPCPARAEWEGLDARSPGWGWRRGVGGGEAAITGREAGSAGRAAGAVPRRTWPGSRRALSRNSRGPRRPGRAPPGAPLPRSRAAREQHPTVTLAIRGSRPCVPRFGDYAGAQHALGAGCGRGAAGQLQRAQPWKRLGAPAGPAPTLPGPARALPSRARALPAAGPRTLEYLLLRLGVGFLYSRPSPGLRQVIPPQGNGSCLSAVERETIYPAGDWVWGGGSHPPPTFPAAPRPRCRARSGQRPQPRAGAGRGAGGGRAVEGRGPRAQSRPEPPFIQHRADPLLLHGFPPLSSFVNGWVRGKGTGKAPLSGLEKKEKKRRGRSGDRDRQTRGQRLWSERLVDTSFPSHPNRMGSHKSELAQLVPSARAPAPRGMLCIYLLQTLPGAPQRPTAQGSSEHPGGAGGAVDSHLPGLEDRNPRGAGGSGQVDGDRRG